jgi:Zn-dependent peptidase ImmA (M78 family)
LTWAFAFAGALLLPEEMMIREVDEGTTLNQFLRIKARYGVSVGAIVVRAERLGLISSMRSRSLHIQLNSRGWRQNEPVLVRAEKPGLLGQAFSRAWGGAASMLLAEPQAFRRR